MKTSRLVIILTLLSTTVLAQSGRKAAPKPTIRQADSLFAAQQWKDAVPVYEAVLKSEPNNSLAWNRLGFISICSFGQSETYLIDFKVQKIIYRGDSILFDNPHIVEIETSKTSEIINIGKIGDLSFGIQLEILKSDLENESRYISGRVYYLRNKQGDWEKIVSYGHSKVSLDNISARHDNERIRIERIKNAKSERLRQLYMTGNSDTSGDPVEFGIYYLIDYYKK